ncbi:MAG: hypothetical protein WC089_03895 [Candidatus Paceibacterota bacterium]
MITWEFPLKTTSEANSREHWHKAAVRHSQQQFFVRHAFKAEIRPIPIPCEITLTRISPRKLDVDENLPMSFKFIKDEIGAQLFPEKVVVYKNKRGKYVQNKGHADSDPRVTWKYAQEKGDIQGIRIEIRSTSAA